MLKLTVVAGSNRGTTYMLRNGENAIGRQAGNAIVLSGNQVSKIHCILIVDESGAFLKDQGSSNGTYVNGVLARERRLGPGDRISIGNFILELSIPIQRSAQEAPALAGGIAPVIEFPGQFPNPFPSQHSDATPEFQAPSQLDLNQASAMPQSSAPTDLKGRVLLVMDRFVMPFFYGLISKSEWNAVFVSLLAVFSILNVIVAVSPLLDSNRESIIKESSKRASFIARQIAESNAHWLASRSETKTEIGLAEKAESVQLALLTEMDGRVIAPVSKAGQYLLGGAEARVSQTLIERYRTGKLKTGWSGPIDETTVMAIWPVEIYQASTASNVIVAMAIVSIDMSSSLMSGGEIGMIYSKSLVLSGLLFAFMGFILYRMTLRPFHQLSEDMDKVLKGDLSQVTHEYKFEEMDSLWDMIHVAVQRIPKNGGTSNALEGGGSPSLEDYLEPLKSLSSAASVGLVVFGSDRRIAYMNEIFEDMSGIRAFDSIGQEISEVARDQSIGQLFSDMFDRASPGGMGVVDDVELTAGILFKLHVAAFGKSGEAAKCYAVSAFRNS